MSASPVARPHAHALHGITLVTGTDTDVGKTVATAALASWLRGAGIEACVVKPVQTGALPGEGADLARIGRLAGIAPDRLVEFARLLEPLAPTTAARRAGVAVGTVEHHAARIAVLAAQHPSVLVEGAGGLLAGLDDRGDGLLELAGSLGRRGLPVAFVVVVRPGLGSLNHTALTVRAITAAGQRVAGLVVGTWPREPGLAERCNVTDLARIAPVLAVLPEGIGDDPEAVARAVAEGPPPGFLPAEPAPTRLERDHR